MNACDQASGLTLDAVRHRLGTGRQEVILKNVSPAGAIALLPGDGLSGLPQARAGTTVRHAHLVLLALIVLFAASVRLLLVQQPFQANTESVGAYNGILARNYLRVPWSISQGVPVQSMGYEHGAPATFYSHHPPLVPLLIAASYAVFGEGEWQTRLPTALCTLGIVLLMFEWLRRLGRPRAGLCAAFLFATMPMSILYGGQPDVLSPQLMLVTLLALGAFLRFHAHPSVRSLLVACAVFLVAALTDWPAFYLVPVVSVYFMLTRPRRSWPWLFAYVSAAAMMFLLIYAHIVLVATHDWLWMRENLATRTAGLHEHIGWGPWLATAYRFNADNHTLPVLLLAAAWFLGQPARFRRPMEPAATLAWLVLAFAALHVLIGRQGCFVHLFWWWPMTLALTIAAGLMCDHLLQSRALARVPVAPKHALIALVAIGFCAGCLRAMPIGSVQAGGVPSERPDYYQVMAAAIRAVAPEPGMSVAFASDDTYPPLWYYADRAIKNNVWSPADLQQSLHGGITDLPFGFAQPWPRPPVALVVPKGFGEHTAELLQYVRLHYPAIAAGPALDADYLFFDLTRPLSGSALCDSTPWRRDDDHRGPNPPVRRTTTAGCVAGTGQIRPAEG